MRYEIFRNDPLHDTLEAMCDKLKANGKWDDLLISARNAHPSVGDYSLDVTFTAMRLWIREMETPTEAKDFTAFEMVREIEGRTQRAAEIVIQKHSRRPDDNGYSRG